VFQSKRRFTLLATIGVAIMSMALFASVASAEEPAPGFERFAGCPSPEESPESIFCLRSEVTGGHLQMGSKDVPVKNPLTIVGGLNGELENFTYNSKGGLSKTKQEVPGGIIGLTGLDWLINFLNLEALKLYAVTEFAGTPSNFTVATVTLPIKVNLINPILGKNCYIGSNSNPIVLNLTTGTTEPPPPNEPITGKFPEVVETEEIIFLNNGIYVDNAFSAPGATGCVLNLFGFIPISLNGFINETSELPSPAGTNEVVQDFGIEITAQEFVYP
jgi:hypothetical protein